MPDKEEDVENVNKNGFVDRLSLALFGDILPDETEEVEVKNGLFNWLLLNWSSIALFVFVLLTLILAYLLYARM
ncbi:MAG: hypothetical protein K0A90_03335 [Methanosarcinaceae archaeon]|nr:hypothetical protein [Methanosarcinaceae archaeon]